MRKNNYVNLESRELQRSDYRRLPDNCLYCAYRLKPSATFDSCTACFAKTYKVEKVKNINNKP